MAKEFFCSPMPKTFIPASRNLVASLVKSLSLLTTQNPSTRPVYKISIASMISAESEEYWSTGVVKEFVPERKLVVTDNFSDEKGNIKPASEYGMAGDWPKELLITVYLEEADGATKMKLRHEGIPDEMRDDCIQGWNESLDKLENNIK